MTAHHQHTRTAWIVLFAVVVLLSGVTAFAVFTREAPPIATVPVSESTSLELATVLTARKFRHDLSPWSRRMYWKLPRELRGAVLAFGRPPRSQVVRASNPEPDDLELIFVARSKAEPYAEDNFVQELIAQKMGVVRLSAGDAYTSSAILTYKPPRGKKIISSARFSNIPAAAEALTVEFLAAPITEDQFYGETDEDLYTTPSLAGVSIEHQFHIKNPLYQPKP